MTDSQQVQGRHAAGRTGDSGDDRGEDQAQGPTQARDRGPERPGHDREVAAGGPERVAAQHEAHGQSLASWTAVGVIMFGALIMGIALVVTTVWLFVVGAVVVVVGAVAGKVLSAMGFGVSGRPGH